MYVLLEHDAEYRFRHKLIESDVSNLQLKTLFGFD